MARETTMFRFKCPGCGAVKALPQRPAMPPTCCGQAMDPLQ